MKVHGQAAGAKKVEGFPKLWVLTKEFSFDSKSYRLDFFFQVTGEGEQTTHLHRITYT